jgi:hypothetical protein
MSPDAIRCKSNPAARNIVASARCHRASRSCLSERIGPEKKTPRHASANSSTRDTRLPWTVSVFIAFSGFRVDNAARAAG